MIFLNFGGEKPGEFSVFFYPEMYFLYIFVGEKKSDLIVNLHRNASS